MTAFWACLGATLYLLAGLGFRALLDGTGSRSHRSDVLLWPAALLLNGLVRLAAPVVELHPENADPSLLPRRDRAPGSPVASRSLPYSVPPGKE